MGESVLNVNLVLDNRTIAVPYNNSTIAEDVCIHICKQLNIGPLTRHLFALRVTGKSIFLMPSAKFGDNYCNKITTVDFRIRFKVADIPKLANLDMNTYNYYFHQARNDVLENRIPDIIYEKYRKALVGLGITDMYRVMLEKDIPRGSVENDYKKYIPKEVLKRHPFFIKKPIHDFLGKLQKSVSDPLYVKAEYLRQLKIIAPEYLSETYKAITNIDGDDCSVILKLSPYDPIKPGLKYYVESKKDQEGQLICTIEEINVISINNNGSIEIFRHNGVPFYLTFHSKAVIYSFISLLDGYYRLTCKWIFNICKEVDTPSLRKLHAMKSHGPVGGEFSYAKLEAKCANQAGYFIIRESESKYNHYYIDVCVKNGVIPKTFKLEKITGDEFIFNDDLTRYKSIHQLMAAYNDPNGAIYLHKCLPPTEYDDSPLLLCKSENMMGDSLTDSSALKILMPSSPVCINCKDLQVYKDMKCLKWNKERKKVYENGNFLKFAKFDKQVFPDNDLSEAKKYCRNPNADIGGPWCFVENEDTGQIEREYCDIPFCDDPECLVFTRSSDTYMHYTDFNNTLANLTFGIKLWDSDSYLDASARLVLSVLALPLTGKEIEDAGIGIEIVIGNNFSALRYGNKDRPDYEPTTGVLKSTEFTIFSLSWHAGFITFGLEGQIKSIFLAEYKIKKNLLRFNMNKFNYYSAQGTNILWYFPFCKDDFECDVHTTTGGEFQQFWPLRESTVSRDLYIHLRAFRSAAVLIVPSPTINYPFVKIVFFGDNNYTTIITKEFQNGPEKIEKKVQLYDIVDYWAWREFSLTVFANTMHIHMKKPAGMQTLAELTSDVFRKIRWFSVSSDNTVAHWSFFCVPPDFSNPPPALLPECALNKNEPDYKGTQDITSEGLPCLPWSGKHLLEVDVEHLFTNESTLQANNYCRDPSGINKGSWCYTTDPDVFQDVCNVRDCDKPEECITIAEKLVMGRNVYILPQWKETGLHGGLRFAIKQWNPDEVDGLNVLITPRVGLDYISLLIGAEDNQRILLYHNEQLVEEKTFPHVISSGKWTELWLQIRWGEIMLGFEGVPAALFEWKTDKSKLAFDPMYINYGSIAGNPLGLFFKCVECHTENTTTNSFDKFQPIGLWSTEELPVYNNLTLRIRGEGVILLSFTFMPTTGYSYVVKMDNIAGKITVSRDSFGSVTLLTSSMVKGIIMAKNWTQYDIIFNDKTMNIKRDNQTVLLYKNDWSLLIYWFSVGVETGWVTWSANCEPLDLDGIPRDGGWSAWSPWTCTVTCGGGEGFRTRTCTNPLPNIFGKLCVGSPTSTGKCNDFTCGDVSPSTLDKIREHLQKESFSYVIDEGQKKEGSSGITVVFKSMWKVAKGKKIQVAMKMLKEESADRYLKDMLTLAGKWAFLPTYALARLYGIAFTSNISLVLEYFPLGPLDQYLRENRGILKTVDLMQAACNLAWALMNLTEKNIVHGNIRCKKLMVQTHEANCFAVKLTDPGIHTTYASSEVHWIPIECYANLNYAKQSSEADVWSVGTTLWEIFTFGEEITPIEHTQAMRWYISGKRLPKPQSCPSEIYAIMESCWDMDPHKRIKPHAMMRDINQIMYQDYGPRQHIYETVLPKRPDIMPCRDSLTSVATESTVLVDFIAANDSDYSDGSSQSVGPDIYNDSNSYDFHNFMSTMSLPTATTSVDSLNSIFELDDYYDVVLQGKIGQGFYGEVYKGGYYDPMQNNELKRVAVKKLKANALISCMQDFEREINIMKSLDHPNIVKIVGVKRYPEIILVMEFVEHGSLQSYLNIYRESLEEAQLLKYASDIAKGMDYLGGKNIVHRDLAARNVLVVDKNHVKISDFGLAQVMGTNDYYIMRTTNRELPIKWYAPESIIDGKFSSRSDVWSYGVTMCEMFNYGEEPNLPNIDENMKNEPQQVILLDAIKKGIRFPCPPYCPKIVYARIIYPCWHEDSHSRPTFAQLITEIEDLYN